MSASLPRATEAVGSRADVVRQTAARLFEASGYAATTMNDIADAVGVLPGSLYHHFRSKEDIAVDLLTALGHALEEVGTDPTAEEPDPEKAVRLLARRVVEVSFQHGAAVRLRAHEAPPSVATDRFHQAMRMRSPALDRAWRQAIAALGDSGAVAPEVDLGLLRFALQHLTLNAASFYPGVASPAELAAHLCDVVLHGLVARCPVDAELDDSPALKAATEVVASWRHGSRATPANDREAIVAAARAEFARRGYEATTIRDVAIAAGVRMGTLYRRIESKEALLGEILGSYGSRFEQAFQAIIAAGAPAPQTLDAVARVFVYVNRRHPEERRIVTDGWNRRETTTGPLHDYFIATERRLAELRKIVRHGVTAGELRRIADPTETALHFRSLIWVPYQEHGRTSEVRAHTFVREAVLRGALTPR